MDTEEFWSTKDSKFIINELANSDLFDYILCDLMDLEILPQNVATSIMKCELTQKAKARIVVENFLFRIENRKVVAINKIVQAFYRNGLKTISDHIHPESSNHYSTRDQCSKFREPLEMMPHMPLSTSLPTFSTVPHYPPPLAEAFTVPDLRESDSPLEVRVTPAQTIYTAEDIYKNDSMPRGLVFIANMKEFGGNMHRVRNGSEVDVDNLFSLFTQMGYYVETHENLSKGDLLKALENFRNDPRHEVLHSCLVVVMSHGKDEHTFYTADNKTLREIEIVDMFSNVNCPALLKKPKIFIFQFCRGPCPDLGVEPLPKLERMTNVLGDLSLDQLQVDSAAQGKTQQITRSPTFTDIFCIFATIEGYLAYLHPTRGSWLVESICQVFMEDAWQYEFEILTKKVSRRLEEFYSSNGRKQIPEYRIRGFTKHFYFNPTPLIETIPGYAETDLGNNNGYLNPLSPSCSVSSFTGQSTPPHKRRQQEWERTSRPSTPDPLSSPRNSIFGTRSRHSTGSGDERNPNPSVRPKWEVGEGVRRASYSGISTRRIDENTRYENAKNHNIGFDEVPATGSDVVDTELSPDKMEFGSAEHFRKWRLKHTSEFSETSSSLKRQISIPSESEAMHQVHQVKKYLQVHDINLTDNLIAIENAIKKNKTKFKKKKTEPSSLDF